MISRRINTHSKKINTHSKKINTHNGKESFLVVPLLALKIKKDLSEIALVQPRKAWEFWALMNTQSAFSLPNRAFCSYMIFFISPNRVVRAGRAVPLPFK